MLATINAKKSVPAIADRPALVDRPRVLGLIVKWVEPSLISAPSRRPNNTTTRRRIPASDKHDLWIRFRKTSPT